MFQTCLLACDLDMVLMESSQKRLTAKVKGAADQGGIFFQPSDIHCKTDQRKAICMYELLLQASPIFSCLKYLLWCDAHMIASCGNQRNRMFSSEPDKSLCYAIIA